MKILKAFLLTFIISFAISNVNAQEDNTPLDLCAVLFNMEMVPVQSPPGEVCFEVTVTSDSPAFLFVQADGNRTPESIEGTSLTVTVCTDRYFGIGYDYLVECGVRNENGSIACREGCWVTIDPL